MAKGGGKRGGAMKPTGQTGRGIPPAGFPTSTMHAKGMGNTPPAPNQPRPGRSAGRGKSR